MLTEILNTNVCWRSLAKEDSFILKKGHRVNSVRDMFFVLKGRVRLTASSHDGNEKIIWYLGDNTLFNETPILAAHTFFKGSVLPSSSHLEPVYFHVCEQDTLVGRLSPERVFAEGRAHPELLINLCTSLAFKVGLLAQKLTFNHLASPRQRVFHHLLLLSESQPQEGVISLDTNFQDFANLLGIHRISLYKILEQAKKEGLVEYSRKSKTIRVLDRAALVRDVVKSTLRHDDAAGRKGGEQGEQT